MITPLLLDLLVSIRPDSVRSGSDVSKTQMHLFFSSEWLFKEVLLSLQWYLRDLTVLHTLSWWRRREDGVGGISESHQFLISNKVRTCHHWAKTLNGWGAMLFCRFLNDQLVFLPHSSSLRIFVLFGPLIPPRSFKLVLCGWTEAEVSVWHVCNLDEHVNEFIMYSAWLFVFVF